MHTDVEILSKILTHQIQQYIKKIIHRGQIGFVLGKQSWLNIPKEINVIHHITYKKPYDNIL